MTLLLLPVPMSLISSKVKFWKYLPYLPEAKDATTYGRPDKMDGSCIAGKNVP